ncbi:hypothetical protein [Xenorhabdus szentirmaii]|uniref:Uncharacterized protein n=1 Tax=Xenorhabdus szentirmaii DSM 16338 TaxID=1427518 RepID=W1IRH2_9GAMM|nr:hypothetical protein [Xenorhabdus szentirmaii]PHM30562.1 hypothetical protein Xsze_04153 [Xenorhabdus szentirmaii DSM 16338]CDL81029.1 conserved hypothetical protein [Xenorhabdus szentirmaii DSM 16338]
MTMNTATTVNESDNLSLEAMLAALDSGELSKPTVETKNNDLSGLNELEKLAAELSALDFKKDSDLLSTLSPVKVVESEPVISTPESVSLDTIDKDTDELEATMAALSETYVADKPAIEPVKLEVVTEEPVVATTLEDIETEKLAEPRKKEKRKHKISSRPHFELTDLTEEDCEKIGVSKDVLLAAVKKCPKKAQEKVLNIAQWVLRGNELSVYTQLGIECLIKKNTASSEVFRLHMMSNPTRPYPVGTAGTQAGQFMAVFPALGIADRIGKNVTLKADSPLVKLYKEQYSK